MERQSPERWQATKQAFFVRRGEDAPPQEQEGMTRYRVTIGIIQHFSDGDTCQVNVEHTVAMESAHSDDDIYAAVIADHEFMAHAVERAKEGDHVVLIGGECRIYPHHSLVRVSLELLGIERVEAPVVVGAFDM